MTSTCSLCQRKAMSTWSEFGLCVEHYKPFFAMHDSLVKINGSAPSAVACCPECRHTPEAARSPREPLSPQWAPGIDHLLSVNAALHAVQSAWRIDLQQGQAVAVPTPDVSSEFVAAAPREPLEPHAPDDVMDVYVPGAWKCPTCGFALSQATLFMGSGEIGCTRDQVMKMTGELCPNEGATMHRVTWRDRAIENQAWGESLMNEVIAAVGADHLPGALERIKALAAARSALPPPQPEVGSVEHHLQRLECLGHVHGQPDILERVGMLRAALHQPHRCSGCGLRWDGERPGAELCGDCWRKGQDTILALPRAPEPDLEAFLRALHDWLYAVRRTALSRSAEEWQARIETLRASRGEARVPQQETKGDTRVDRSDG